ncbi:hypothetical protein CspeluHIS016_0107040 [Cutaneotrichosporon spelunceum]|uniref:Uncharacterized protein n=1 Tax=Cutaneotrichosporon spelunceum TaxID=1672016 RepID=A0AAD3TNH6_9TREE|nr:hypothetical protein CspeluHIS016_0107040 [Cutaneotrichosporon spelunceum]
MSDAPDSKRQLHDGHARAAAEPTTADIYGQRHGIPDDIQAALQNVGRRNRMMVSQGRSLMPTQSLPVLPSTSAIFLSDRDAQAQARLIVKDDLRLRELQPYSSNPTNALSLSPRARAAELGADQRLRFNADGEVVVERRRGHKRNGEEGDVDDEPGDAVNHALPSAQPVLTSHPVQAVDDFPPAFINPSVPELSNAMLPPPVPARAFAGMPRRQLRPTMSAPVGRLGSEQGGLRGFGMPVEEDDGFDVGDWAAEQESGDDVAGWTRSEQF